ncbi:MAG: serine hydrolase [Candidatus Levybacteria bacterium]|nr:serine hydrolase [Candidatus Levybacteria bacterium]
MIFIVIIGFGLAAFIIVFLYQLIFTTPMPFYQRVLFLIILTGIIVTSAYIRLQYVESDTLEAQVLKPIASPIQKSVDVIQTVRRSKELENIILPIIEAQQGKYSVVIKNLKTGEEYYLNEKERYAAASLYKLWTMATVFQQIKDGKLTMDKTLSADIATLNKAFALGEDAEASEGAITRTVEEAVEQMITISHNYSAILLTYVVKNANVRQFLLNYQLTDSKTGSPPTTTASDISEYYEKLYSGEIISKELSAEMLEILKRQKLNDRIPKYLPEGTVVAHKTGELGGVKHNAGIVYSEKGDYIIVLMSETKAPLKAAEVEAKISKEVWDYFNR